MRAAAGGGEEKDSGEDEKPAYVHVRARRGQATDSHSLAERVCIDTPSLLERTINLVYICAQFDKMIYQISDVGKQKISLHVM